MLDFLRDESIPFVVALTKADKLSRAKADQQAASLARQFGVSRDQMVVTSAEKGTGIDDLRHRIEAAC
jgi:GTP-binding protein